MKETVKVRFPPHLTRHISVPRECNVQGETVADAIRDLDRQFPGVADYLLHENGALREHVNIFLGEQLVRDRRTLEDRLAGVAEMFVMQALSGG